MDFTSALDRSVEEIKRPPVPPVGHYVWSITAHPEKEDFESKKTGDTFDRLTFVVSAVEARDDVDPDELEAYGNVAGYKTRKTFLFNTTEGKDTDFERSLFNLKRFLEHCGLDLKGNLSEALADSVGAQFVGELTHRPDPEDPEVVFAELGRTAEL